MLDSTGGSQGRSVEQKWRRKGSCCEHSKPKPWGWRSEQSSPRKTVGGGGADRKQAERSQGLHTIPISTREAIPQQHTFIKAAEMVHLDLRISTFLQLKKRERKKENVNALQFQSQTSPTWSPSVPWLAPSCPHGSQTPHPTGRGSA